MILFNLSVLAIPILFLDRDSDFGDLVKHILKCKDYQILTKENSDDLEDTLSEKQVRLLVLDYSIDHKNGFNLLNTIKNSPAYQHIPVLMTSTNGKVKEKCLEAGADDFIAKPFHIQDLLTKIENLIKA